MDLSLSAYAVVWAGGFFSGFMDSIAGGGGLISLPVLLSVGVSPHLALGTNKLQSSFGSFTAAANYYKEGLVDKKGVLTGVVITAIGAFIGTSVTLILSKSFLSHIIPPLLAAVFIYTFFSPDFGKTEQKARLNHLAFYGIFGLGIGFYDGFLGPGTGSFWTAAFVVFMGYHLKKATAHTKITNFTSNFVALITFLLASAVDFKIGFLMASGQIIGAFLGSKLVVKKGVGFIRIFFLSVVGLTILKIIYSTYFS